MLGLSTGGNEGMAGMPKGREGMAWSGQQGRDGWSANRGLAGAKPLENRETSVALKWQELEEAFFPSVQNRRSFHELKFVPVPGDRP